MRSALKSSLSLLTFLGCYPRGCDLRILSIDLGTTNLKTSVLEISDDIGQIKVLDSAINRLTFHVPEHGAYEHNPQEIMRLITQHVRHLIHNFKVDAIVLTTYLFATVIVDREFRPRSNIITWLDERSLKFVKLVEEHGPELYRRTGCPPTHIYTLPKLLWLKRKLPETLASALILDGKSLLTSWMLGYPITDLSTASGTYQMLNIRDLKWDPLALEIVGVDEKSLPQLAEAYYTDVLKESVAVNMGLEPGTPVILGLYDGGSMIFGLSGGSKNVAVMNIGTSAMLRTVINSPVVDFSPLMRFQTYYLLDHLWLSGGAVNNAGVVVEFVAKLVNTDVSEFPKILSETPPKPWETPLVIPLLYPERLPFLRGGGMHVLSMRPDTTPRALIWGTVEGVLMLLKLLDDSLRENGILYDEIRIGGGLAKYKGIRETTSLIFGKRVGYVSGVEASHIGNALLAVMATEGSKALNGLVKNLSTALEYVGISEALASEYELKYSKFKHLVFHDLPPPSP
ncbi:MAG: FGGY family carbohydrate kinase [Zestosphaera sp.]